MSGPPVAYTGRDLEAMDLAGAYHRWILDIFRPYLGTHLVEVGAGIGSFSKKLLTTAPERLILVEPSSMFASLRNSLATALTSTKISLYNDLFPNIAAEVKGDKPDSIIYINVLEHIEDDRSELEIVRDTLTQKGRIFIFVPALPVLFSKWDESLGHYRRYGRGELRRKVEGAGFRILDLRWFDMTGIAPWLIKYRLMRSTSIDPRAVRAYDRVVVPVIRPLETLIHPPIGKNLLLIAERD